MKDQCKSGRIGCAAGKTRISVGCGRVRARARAGQAAARRRQAARRAARHAWMGSYDSCGRALRHCRLVPSTTVHIVGVDVDASRSFRNKTEIPQDMHHGHGKAKGPHGALRMRFDMAAFPHVARFRPRARGIPGKEKEARSRAWRGAERRGAGRGGAPALGPEHSALRLKRSAARPPRSRRQSPRAQRAQAGTAGAGWREEGSRAACTVGSWAGTRVRAQPEHTGRECTGRRAGAPPRLPCPRAFAARACQLARGPGRRTWAQGQQGATERRPAAAAAAAAGPR